MQHARIIITMLIEILTFIRKVSLMSWRLLQRLTI